MSNFDPKKMVVVDLGAGKYLKTKTGHEYLNLQKHLPDKKFYGYCPPKGDLKIKAFGANKADSYIDGILVVYTKKFEPPPSTRRKIIAFCPQARVYRCMQSGEAKRRRMPEGDEYANYSIESDVLINIEDIVVRPFILDPKEYAPKMFHPQRFYGGKYPNLDLKIISYIESILENDDHSDDQKQIQEAEPVTKIELQHSADRPVEIIVTSLGESVKKNPSLAKTIIAKSGYKCILDPNHQTFQTQKGVQYMEGHHLIPCTATNAQDFKDRDGKNIDCAANIVSICPTCHRAVHFGDDRTKKQMVMTMYDKQKALLNEAGIQINEDELLGLYNL